MALNQVLAGNIIYADDVQDELDEVDSYARPITATKAVDTGPRVNNTKSADPELAITLPANRTYVVQGWFLVSSASNAAGDFACGWQWTNTATVTATGLGLHNSLASGSQADVEGIGYGPDATTPSQSQPYGASTTPTGIFVSARVVTGTSAVVLTVEWAQANTNASGTTLLTGSHIVARRSA